MPTAMMWQAVQSRQIEPTENISKNTRTITDTTPIEDQTNK